MQGPLSPAADAPTPPRKNAVLAVVLSVLLLLGIGYVLYTLYAAHMSQLAAADDTHLAEEKQRLSTLLTADPCDIKARFDDGSLVAPLASASATTAAPAGAGATGATDVPGAAGVTGATDPTGATGAQAGAAPAPSPATTLNQKLEQATVFIVTIVGDDEVYTGTGFFVAPGIIVTNKHVVEGEKPSSAPRAFAVINKQLRSLQKARLLAVSTGEQQDYAILKLEDDAPSVQPLTFNPQVTRTTRVSAWGFPSAITSSDPQYQALLNGNFTSSPEVVYSDGVVSVILDQQPPIILHTAPLSHGNSGGPLVNEQGEVVGINTLISLDDKSYRQTSVALAASDLIAFLRQHGIQPNTATQQVQ